MRPTPLAPLALVALVGCSDPAEVARGPRAVEGTALGHDFTLADGFYAAPFPSDARRDAEGRPVIDAFPNPTGSALLEAVRASLQRDARGFALTAGVFFAADAALADGAELDFAASVEPGAAALLVDVDPDSPGRLTRLPIQARVHADGGPFGAPHLLSLLPLQGWALAPGTLHAAVVLRAFGDAAGAPLGVPLPLAQLVAGQAPEGAPPEHAAAVRLALDALGELGVDAADIAGLAVFTTDDPAAPLTRAFEAARATPPAPLAALTPAEVFDDFCVLEGRLRFPSFQAGTPPFEETGGAWTLDAGGTPVQQGEEEARLVVTVPRRPAPAAGYPALVFSRTGGGGDRPLVDRGVRDASGAVITPGTGPARELARGGVVGVMVDGPHGGLRNVTGRDEQFLMFNVANPDALRDNVRQSALELALLLEALPALELPVGACPGADGGAALARIDGSHLGLMGHSMGATIAPLTAAVAPSLGALVLSGAGGSYIENVVWKQEPLSVKGPAELLLGVAGRWSLHEHDPVLSLFQWAVEASDPPVYGRALRARTPALSVLMLQGIVDHYILPPIANATSLGLGLDLAGTPLDAGHPELSAMTPLGELLPLSGGAVIALPAQGNRGAATAVVVQHAEDGVEDGHEVVFQTEAPKHQYRCFLQTWAAGGAPRVPAGGASTDPCP